MPPKRRKSPTKQPEGPAPQPSKQRKRSSTSAPPTQMAIDYDLLADAVLKKQRTLDTPALPAVNSDISNSVPSSTLNDRVSTDSNRHQVPNHTAQILVSADIHNENSNSASQTHETIEASPLSAADPADNFNIPAVLNTLFGGNLYPGTMAQQTTSANPTSPPPHLSTTAISLLHSSLALSTKTSYKHSWFLFLQFCDQKNLNKELPVSVITLCNFIAHLFEQNYSHFSITSMVSAISFVHKVLNLPDHSQNFLVQKILHGASKIARTPDYRLPITTSILVKLVNALPFTVPNFYHRILLHCIFTVAFHGVFRLGELIAKTPSHKSCIIQRQDISIQGNSKVEIILRYSKTMQTARPITIYLSKATPQEICPVQSLQMYLSYHKH
ncbi:uncharacterized protein LOC134278735 [Saccostrea cucullata]|uniref:uncharacterized protein LOC134278735 n=1 Tax=Saccostrea cuccullata TaxID=36930 RepID=UPI002ED05F82